VKGVQLEKAARLLFGGDDWRQPFEARYGVNQVTIRRMLKDEKEIPPGLASELERDMHGRCSAIEELLYELVEANW